MEDLASVFAYISAVSPFFALITGIIAYKTFSSYLKVLFIYICIACCIEAISFYTLYLNVENNLFLGQINCAIEFSAFAYMYITLLKIKQPLIVFASLSILFTYFVIMDVFYIEGVLSVNALSKNTEAIILIAFSIIYFYKLITRAEHEHLLKLPAFWMCTGAIIYFSGRFFIILFSNYLIENDTAGYAVFFIIHSIFNLTFNILIAIGFLKQRYVG